MNVLEIDTLKQAKEWRDEQLRSRGLDVDEPGDASRPLGEIVGDYDRAASAHDATQRQRVAESDEDHEKRKATATAKLRRARATLLAALDLPQPNAEPGYIAGLRSRLEQTAARGLI